MQRRSLGRLWAGLAALALLFLLANSTSFATFKNQKYTAKIEKLQNALAAANKRNLALRDAFQSQFKTLSQAQSASTGTLPPRPNSSCRPESDRVYVHSIETMPVTKGELVMMTYATGGVHDLTQNWVMHIQRLGMKIIAIAMDEALVAQCIEQKFDCLDWSRTRASTDSMYVRGDEAGFRALGVRKVDALIAVLRAGVHVVLSDVDCVWSADPTDLVLGRIPQYSAFAEADLIVSTDCMDPIADREDNGCYSSLIDKNTGIIAIKPTEDGIAAMAEWRIRLAIGQKNEQDQTTFMDLIDGNGRGHRWGMSDSQRKEFQNFAAEWCEQMRLGRERTRGRAYLRALPPGQNYYRRQIFDVCLPNVTRTLKLGVFPITEVSGGHTFMVQQLQSTVGKWPMAVHATYQFGDNFDYAYGKRQRFRDWGLWLADDETDLAMSEGRYLVLVDDEPLAPVKPIPTTFPRSAEQLHERGRQHVDHLTRFRQRLAIGVSLARILNRTVVLPTMYCYCDKFWHRVDACAIPQAGGHQPLPFVCPMDHVMDPSLWHGLDSARKKRSKPGILAARADGPWSDGMPFRGPNWIKQIGNFPSVAKSTATLVVDDIPSGYKLHENLVQEVIGRGEESKAAIGFVPGEEGPRLRVPLGSSDLKLRILLEPYAHIRLLRTSLSAAGKALGCIVSTEHADEHRRLMHLLFQASWCYRPSQMTLEWLKVDRGPKPIRGTEPWCVWGYEDPKSVQVCTHEAGSDS